VTDSFWADGPDAYREGLSEHYKPLLAELRTRRKSAATILERVEIDEEIERLNAKLKSRLDDGNEALF